MITLSILFIICYSYSVYRIKEDSGSWKEFNPYSTGLFAHMIFMIGTAAICIAIIISVGLLAISGIIP
jgi:hypothetical protein